MRFQGRAFSKGRNQREFASIIESCEFTLWLMQIRKLFLPKCRASAPSINASIIPASTILVASAALIFVPALLLSGSVPAQAHQFAHCYKVLKPLGAHDADASLTSARAKLAKNPNDTKSLWIEGMVLQLQLKPIEAERAFLKLLDAAKKQKASKKELAAIYGELSILQTQNGHGQDATASFKKSLELDSQSENSHLIRGWQLWQEMNKDALAEFDDYIAMAKDEDSYVSKAHYLFQIGRREEGFKLLAEADKKFPDSPFLNFERAYMCLMRNDLIGAEKYADMAQKKLRIGGYIYGDIATQYKRQGDIEKQLSALRKMGVYWPRPETYSVLALYLQQRGKIDEAAKALDKAHELYPSIEEYVDRKCKMYRMAGRWKEALAVAQYKVEKFPKTTHSYIARGLCYEALGEYKKAVEDFDRGIAKNANWREVVNRAKCNLILKNYKRVLDDANAMIANHPGHITGIQLKARAYMGMGKLNEALAEADTLSKMSADNVEFIKLRAEVLQKMGRTKEASAELAKIKKIKAAYE
jgi:tetratricopeptide (TPR) repeat protein